ncbi:hypothetical protein J6590_066726 [Homalodisca vitripennis]|nr:hypothetical protein J6590_066726 [Homalodisca vitripennis]
MQCSGPCKRSTCPAIGGGSEITFKPLVRRLSVIEGFLALTSPVVKSISKHLGLKKLTPINKVAVPQQSNGVDCGIYMLIFGDGTFYEIKNSPVPGFWPDIKPSDIITKRAQLALMLHNNNLSALTPDTAAELMYQVPAPILTHARPESPISVSSDTVAAAITPVRHTEDLNLHKTPQNCTCNQEKNTQEENWSEVKKKNRNSKKQKKRQPWTWTAMDQLTQGLPELIGACSKGKIKVSGLVMPGATTKQVYKQAEGALCRPTVIIAGTNNITKKSTGEIYTNLEGYLQSLSTQRTVHITTIPYRYDEILEAATTTSEQYTSKDLREAVPQEHDELHMTDSVDDFPPLLTKPMSKTVFNNHSDLFSNSCIASDISCSKTDENVIPLNQDNDVTPDAPPLNSPRDLVLHPT